MVFWLLLAFAFCLPFENTVEFGPFGRVSKVVGLVLGLAWGLLVVVNGELRRPRPAHVAALAFALWGATSLVWSVDVGYTVDRLVTCAQLVAVLVIVWDLVDDERDLRSVMRAYVAGAWVPILLVLRGYLEDSVTFTHGRLTVEGFHPNDLGLVLALGVPFAWYLATTAKPAPRGRIERVTCSIYVPLAVLITVLTGSRTSLAALAPWLVWFLVRETSRRPWTVLPAVGALVWLGWLLLKRAPERPLARLGDTGQEITEGGLTGRSAVWSEALDLMQSDPLTGAGLGAFRTAAVDSGKVGHNVVLGLAVEVGIVGLVLFLVIAVAAWRAGRSTAGRQRAFWTTLLLGWAVAASFHNWEYRKQTWFFFGLALAAGALESRRRDDLGTDDRSPVLAGAVKDTAP
jgi:O-antigen ligase